MEIKHSPAPFTKDPLSSDSWMIRDAKDNPVVYIRRDRTEHERPDETTTIMRKVPVPNADADAALLAEAPTLLQASIEAVAEAERALAITTFPDGHPIAKLKASIKRALTVEDGAVAYACAEAERIARLDASIQAAMAGADLP